MGMASSRRGLLGMLLYGQLGELLLDGELIVSPELEAEFVAERRAEARAVHLPDPQETVLDPANRGALR
jgi:hypothetical protein